MSVIASAIFAATTVAQKGPYSSIESVSEFVSRLDISQASQNEVYAIFDEFQLNDHLNMRGNKSFDQSERARLACQVGHAIFGSILYTPASTNFGDLINDNWSVQTFHKSYLETNDAESSVYQGL